MAVPWAAPAAGAGTAVPTLDPAWPPNMCLPEEAAAVVEPGRTGVLGFIAGLATGVWVADVGAEP